MTSSAVSESTAAALPASHPSAPCLMVAFEAICEAPSADRDALIALHCGDDAQMHQELRQMLADREQTQGREIHAGDHLGDGRYVLARRLGSGSFGSVWLAQDKTLACPVAIKLLKNDSDAAQRLALCEARAASAVVSEHVRRILDVAYDATSDVSYMVMEPCQERAGEQHWDAETMRECHPESLSEALKWCRDVALGVHAVHQQGLFHGDLKPDNVLILGKSRKAKIIDFGAAGRIEERPGHPTAPLRFGTPAYMAPEQAAGCLPPHLDASQPLDHQILVRLDIYAIGALLYELLSGAPPYRPRRGAQRPVADVLAQICEGQPIPLRGPPGRNCRFPMGRRLQRIVKRAMHPVPSMRFETAQVLADDIQAIIDGSPTSLDTGAERTILRMLRHKWTAVFLTLMVTVGLQQGQLESLKHQAQAVVERTARNIADDAAIKAERLRDWERETRLGTENALSEAVRIRILAKRRFEELQEQAQAELSDAVAMLVRRVRPSWAHPAIAKDLPDVQSPTLAPLQPVPTSLEPASAGDMPATPIGEENGNRVTAPKMSFKAEPYHEESASMSENAENPFSGFERKSTAPLPGTPASRPLTHTAPALVDALASRYLAAVRSAGRGEVIEARDSKNRLTHLWIKQLSAKPISTLVLTPKKHGRLERILGKRSQRRVEVFAANGRITSICVKRNTAGSHVRSTKMDCTPPLAVEQHAPYGVQVGRASQTTP